MVPDGIKYTEPERAKGMRMYEILYNFGRCDFFVMIDLDCLFLARNCKVQTDRIIRNYFNLILMVPPTSYSTVYTTLKRVMEQMNSSTWIR